MSSLSLQHWRATAAIALDGMEAAHLAVRGTGRGSRLARQQLNQSYLMLVSSHFQLFCRDLHTEAAMHLVSSVDPAFRGAVQRALVTGRKLDQGNPNPGNLGADFGRLGIGLWPDVLAVSARNLKRRDKLVQMGHWRNAIAHQDFTGHAQELGGRSEIALPEVRAFRSNCAHLAMDFDTVVLAYIKTIVGSDATW